MKKAKLKSPFIISIGIAVSLGIVCLAIAQSRSQVGPFGKLFKIENYAPNPGEIEARKEQTRYVLSVENDANRLLQEFWSAKDFSSAIAYEKSLVPYRDKFAFDLGLTDDLRYSRNASLLSSKFVTSFEGINVYRWIIRTGSRNFQIEALVAIPQQRSEPMPAIIGLHGTYGSPELVLGLTGNQDYHRKFGYYLARQGYAVVVPYLNIFGAGEIVQFNQFARGVGITQQGMSVGQVIGLMNYMDTQQRFINGRYGVVGLSFGGSIARWSAAIDQRVVVTIDSMSSFDPTELLRNEGLESQLRMEAPKIRNDQIRWTPRYTAAMIMPRAYFIETASQDPYAVSAEANYNALRPRFVELGFGDNIGFFKGDLGHTIYLKDSLDFLKQRMPPAQYR